MTYAELYATYTLAKNTWASVKEIARWLEIGEREQTLSELLSSSIQSLEESIDAGVDRVIDKIERDGMEKLHSRLKVLFDLFGSGIMQDTKDFIPYMINAKESLDYAKNRLAEGKLDWFAPYCIGNAMLQLTKAELGIDSKTFMGDLDDGLSIARQTFVRIVSLDACKKLKENTVLYGALSQHTGLITAICCSADGALMASGSLDTTIKIWDMGSRECVNVIRNEGAVNALDFSSDGSLFAASIDSPNGSYGHGVIKIWDVARRQYIHSLSKNSTHVSFRPGTKILASMQQEDGMSFLSYWDVSPGKKKAEPVKNNSISSGHIDLSPDQRTLALAHDKIIIFYDLVCGSVPYVLRDHECKYDYSRIDAISFNSDGKLFAWAIDEQHIKVLHYETKEITHTLKLGRKDSVESICFDNDNQRLISCNSKNVQIWEIKTGNLLLSLEDNYKASDESGIYSDISITLSPKGKFLAWAGRRNEIVIICVDTGHVLNVINTNSEVYSVAFSSDELLLASHGETTISIWNKSDGVCLKEIKTKTYSSTNQSIKFSPDGRFLAYITDGSSKGVLEIFDLSNNTVFRSIKEDYNVQLCDFTNDSQSLISITHPMRLGIKFWNIETGELTRLIDLTGDNGKATCFCYNANGDLLAIGTDENTISLLHVDIGMYLSMFKCKEYQDGLSKICCIRFSHNGKFIAAGVGDIEGGGVWLIDQPFQGDVGDPKDRVEFTH